MKMTKLATALALVIGVASGSAMADEGGYVVADLGPSSYGFGNSPIGFDIGGGYNFLQLLDDQMTIGAEGTYADFGSSTVTNIFGTVSVKTTGVMADGVVYWKIPHATGLEVYGKVGFMHASISTPSFGGTVSTTNNNTFFGVGVKYSFDKNWAVRAQYADYGSTVSGLTAITVGGMYSF
jgi:hypothetical protein